MRMYRDLGMRVRAEKLRTLDADGPVTKSGAFGGAGNDTYVIGHILRSSERRIRQHDRRLDLTIRYRPVHPKQLGLALRRDELKVVAPVKVDRPCGRGPGAHQHASRAQATKMLDQYRADAVSLTIGQNVGVTDQIDVAYGLNAHHAYDRPIPLVGPESNSSRD